LVGLFVPSFVRWLVGWFVVGWLVSWLVGPLLVGWLVRSFVGDHFLLKDFEHYGMMFILCFVTTVATLILLSDFGPY
jgi:hypothetical protein